MAEQVALVQRNLPQIMAAIANDAAIEGKLQNIRRAHFRRRWGGMIDVSADPFPVSTFNPPSEVEEVWAWLTDQGFHLEEHYSPKYFGNRILRFTRSGCEIEFIRDRGFWSLDIGGTQFIQKYDASRWQPCVSESSERVEFGAVDNREQITAKAVWLRRSLNVIERALSDPKAIEDCLRQTTIT